MRKCLFRIEGPNAVYIKEYEEEPLNQEEVIVTFTHNNFADVVHIDDGDWKCMEILRENGMHPTITR